MSKAYWTNDENDFYWELTGHEQLRRWIGVGVERFEAEWKGDPQLDEGCQAEITLAVRMPTDLTAFGNGDSLVVARNCCGPRGRDFEDKDVRVRVDFCAVWSKYLSNLAVASPDDVEVVTLTLNLEGALKIW